MTPGAPKYLKRAYAEIIHNYAAREMAYEVRRGVFVRGNTGSEIRRRLDSLGSDLRQPHEIRFTLKIRSGREESVTNNLKERGFETDGAGYGSDHTTLHFKKELIVDEQPINILADEISEIATSAGGKLSEFLIDGGRAQRIERIESVKPVKKKAWWRFRRG